MTLPPKVSVGTITGRFLAARLDDADAGTAPQGVAVDGLTITLTPREVEFARLAVDPTTILFEPIELATDAEGYVINPITQARATEVVATDDPDLEPTNWTYYVQIKTPLRGVVRAFDMAVPRGTTVDLTTVVPVSPGTPEDQAEWVVTITQMQALVADVTTTKNEVDAALLTIPTQVADAMDDDPTIRQAALNALQDEAVQALLAWRKPDVLSNQDFNTIMEEGLYVNLQGGAPNQPQASLGVLEVLPMGTWLVQRYTTSDPAPRAYQRRYAGGNWSSWEPTSLRLGEMSSASDLDTFVTEGMVGCNSSNRPNQPVAEAGHLQVMRLGTVGVIQRYTTWATTPREFVRRGSTNGSFPWTAWVEFVSVPMLDAAIAGVQASIATVSGSGTKIAPLAVTLPGGTVTRTTVPTGAARWTRRYAHMPSRVRLHVSNRNPANLSLGGAMNLIGARIGIANPTQPGRIDSQVSAMPANQPLPVSTTAELVGPWIDVPGVDGDTIGITLAWDGGGTGAQQMLYGGGWTMENSTAGWDNISLASGFSRSLGMTPFYVWLEAEVPARVPLVGGMGDSITVGTATDDPVGEGAWLHLYARSENALPVFYAQHGSTSASWGVGNHRWTSGFYPGLQVPLDAMVRAIGRNDITAGITLADLAAKDKSVSDAIKAVWPKTPQFLATITPYAGEDAAAGQVRRDHNLVRKTLPNGERGIFDFDAAVGTPGSTALATEFSADGLHPNAAGQAAMAALITARPVTPFVMTEAKMRALSV